MDGDRVHNKVWNEISGAGDLIFSKAWLHFAIKAYDLHKQIYDIPANLLSQEGY